MLGIVGKEDNNNSRTMSSVTLDNTTCTIYVQCFFTDSSASACVVLYWQITSNPYGLVNLNTMKLDRQQNQNNIISQHISLEDEGYHVAVFAFSSDKDRIEGQSLATSFILCEQGIIIMLTI